MKKSSLLFLFALVFGLLGAAIFINNALYTNKKIFISWLLMYFQSNYQWFFSIFFWVVAGGFLISGIFYRRIISSSRHSQFNQSETTRKTRVHSPAIGILPFISVLGVSFVCIGSVCLCTFVLETWSVYSIIFEENLSYQGHVYALSVEHRESDDRFNFEVSQCDASGWFCHVICDTLHYVNWEHSLLSNDISVYAYLQADAPYHHLFIYYVGGGTYDNGTHDSGKLLCSIPSS